MPKQNFFVGDSPNLLPLRIAIGAVFIMHGGRTLFINGIPWFAGYLQSHGIPLPMAGAVVAAAVEFIGGIAMIIGFYPRIAGFFLAIDMVVAFFAVHLRNGFFIQKSGFEYVMILFAGCLVFVLASIQKRPPPSI